ncbi:MAG TPA: hypothetical protein VFB58_03400 [Chloroflexota bacterium]|nr:hypothetical protein [Chloroflexota bacterium]
MTDNDPLADTVLRLLAARQGRPAERPRLLPQSLPPDLPFDLPVPPETRLVGSLASANGGTVILDTSMEPRAIMLWYRDALAHSGWKSYSMEDRIGEGVDKSEQVSVRRTFWHPRKRYSAALHARRSDAGRADVELTVDTSGRSAENVQRAERWRRIHRGHVGNGRLGVIRAIVSELRVWWENPLSGIRAPIRSQYREEGGGSSSSGYYHRHAELRTSLDITGLARHYHRQWARRGWRLLDEGVAGPVAWSFWEKEIGGKRREARWLAHHLPDTPEQYSLSMSVAPGGARSGASIVSN